MIHLSKLMLFSLFWVKAPCLSAGTFVHEVYSNDIHYTYFSVRTPWVGSDSPQAAIHAKFSGNYLIPKIQIPSDKIVSVKVDASFAAGAAAAGQNGYEAMYKFIYNFPEGVFEEDSFTFGSESKEFNFRTFIPENGPYDLGGMIFTLGPNQFSSKTPQSFLSESPNQHLNIQIDSEFFTVGRYQIGQVHPKARHYAIFVYVPHKLRIIYEFIDGYELPAHLHPLPQKTDVKFSRAVGMDDMSRVGAADWWPAEYSGQEIPQTLNWHSRKRFDISVRSLHGFRYTLKRSIGMNDFTDVESKAGAQGMVSFAIDDESSNDPAAFYKVVAEEVPFDEE